MTIEQYTPPTPAVVSPQDQAVMRLTEWANSARAAHAVATSLVQTSFVPAQFKGKPEEATAAILSGLEIGLSPMSALRAFDIISGQAAPRAITLRAVVQAAGHEMELIETTETRCRMRGRRRGASEWQSVTWTIDRARNLNLTGKDNWKKQPGAMLVARATSELARLIASDAILGIGYSSEEVADGLAGNPAPALDGPESPAAIETGPTKRLSRPRAQRPPSGPEVAPVAEPEPAPEPEPTPDTPDADADPVAPALLDTKSPLARRMFAALNAAGVTDRDDRLTYVNDVIGRVIAGSAELTEDEAKAVIAAAEAEALNEWAEPLKDYQP